MYEHEHFGPRIHIVAVIPAWPVAWMARACLYTHHLSAYDSVKQWIDLNNGKVTSRTITATIRGTANVREGGTPGGQKAPYLIPARIASIMRKASTDKRAKYNHIILPNMDQVWTGEKGHQQHHYLPHDHEIHDGLLEYFERNFTNEIFTYYVDIDESITGKDMPVPWNHTQWFAWRLMFSMLNKLPWPLNTSYYITKELGARIMDTPIRQNLFEYAAEYEDARADYLAELP